MGYSAGCPLARAARVLLCALPPLVAGCASLSHDEATSDPVVTALVARSATPVALPVCHGYGCQSRHVLALSASEWERIRALFDVANAENERLAIAQAVALVEQAAGKQFGTSADRPGTPFIFYDPTQLDCVDESVNTSSVLHLLQRSGLLRYHSVGEPRLRRGRLGFGLHFTATLRAQASGIWYAVDSWFFAGGKPPAIIPLQDWYAGWEPEAEATTADR